MLLLRDVCECTQRYIFIPIPTKIKIYWMYMIRTLNRKCLPVEFTQKNTEHYWWAKY